MAETKNVVDKTNLETHTGASVDETKVASKNWISQIKASDGVTYDIATHHSIKFVDGNGGDVTEWSGLTDLEVVIPSIQDIVQTPIEFAGTVDKSGNITWVNGHSKEEAGSLVFITEDCTFAEKVCEAGDMAIYDGTTWRVISGENQVSIVGNNGEAKTTINEKFITSLTNAATYINQLKAGLSVDPSETAYATTLISVANDLRKMMDEADAKYDCAVDFFVNEASVEELISKLEARFNISFSNPNA
jgi:hypothetical protein